MSHRLPWTPPNWMHAASSWASSVLWASLPWLVGSAIQVDEVSIILLAVCGFGLATDALFVPQTVDLQLSRMMLFYSSSYVIAFMVNERWLATLALTVFTAHLVGGAAGIEAVKRRLIHLDGEAERESLIDPLTGLWSLRGASRDLERRLERGDHVVCAAIDLDDFKATNDLLGCEGSDEVLRAVARRLQQILPDSTIARLHGDRFLVVRDRAPSIDELEALPSMVLGLELSDVSTHSVSLSIGIASTETANDPDSLLRHADLALRQAKRRGKQQIVHATPRLLASSRTDAELSARTRSALTNGEFVGWAQPIVNIERRSWAGFEMLARWPQPDGALINPGQFVPIIEAQGSSRTLGHLMLSEAISLLRQLQHAGHHDIFVTVNLSALHLVSHDLPRRLRGMLDAAQVNPACLVLEMTETQRLPDRAAANAAFERLRSLGVGIASDDVGSGWSSLNQLMTSPFTHVKVDRELINGAHRRGAADLLTSIRVLAEGSGQIAVAEGVETEAELAVVRSSGFVLAQGYLFAHPMPVEDALLQLEAGEYSADIA